MPKPDGLAPDRAGFTRPLHAFWPFFRAAEGSAEPGQALHAAQLCAARDVQAFWQRRASGWQELWQAGAAAGLRAAFCAPADPAGAIREISEWQVHALQQTVQDAQDYADLSVRCGANLLSAARRAGQAEPAEPTAPHAAPLGEGAPSSALTSALTSASGPRAAPRKAAYKARARGHATPV